MSRDKAINGIRTLVYTADNPQPGIWIQSGTDSKLPHLAAVHSITLFLATRMVVPMNGITQIYTFAAMGVLLVLVDQVRIKLIRRYLRYETHRVCRVFLLFALKIWCHNPTVLRQLSK